MRYFNPCNKKHALLAQLFYAGYGRGDIQAISGGRIITKLQSGQIVKYKYAIKAGRVYACGRSAKIN